MSSIGDRHLLEISTCFAIPLTKSCKYWIRVILLWSIHLPGQLQNVTRDGVKYWRPCGQKVYRRNRRNGAGLSQQTLKEI